MGAGRQRQAPWQLLGWPCHPMYGGGVGEGWGACGMGWHGWGGVGQAEGKGRGGESVWRCSGCHRRVGRWQKVNGSCSRWAGVCGGAEGSSMYGEPGVCVACGGVNPK